MSVDGEKFRIFVSWSKSPSREVAAVVKDLLSEVLDAVEVFVSSVDLVPGRRPMRDIHDELSTSDAGVLMVTRANQVNPWINYEAGVLSQSRDGKERLVIPLLIDSQLATDVLGPLADLQNAAFTRDDILKMVRALAEESGTDVSTAEKRFERAWEECLEKYRVAMTAVPTEHSSARTDSEKLDEVLDRVRGLTMELATRQPDFPPTWGAIETQVDQLRLELAAATLDSAVVRVARTLEGTTLMSVFVPQLYLVPARDIASKFEKRYARLRVRVRSLDEGQDQTAG